MRMIATESCLHLMTARLPERKDRPMSDHLGPAKKFLAFHKKLRSRKEEKPLGKKGMCMQGPFQSIVEKELPKRERWSDGPN